MTARSFRVDLCTGKVNCNANLSNKGALEGKAARTLTHVCTDGFKYADEEGFLTGFERMFPQA